MMSLELELIAIMALIIVLIFVLVISYFYVEKMRQANAVELKMLRKEQEYELGLVRLGQRRSTLVDGNWNITEDKSNMSTIPLSESIRHRGRKDSEGDCLILNGKDEVNKTNKEPVVNDVPCSSKSVDYSSDVEAEATSGIIKQIDQKVLVTRGNHHLSVVATIVKCQCEVSIYNSMNKVVKRVQVAKQV